MLCRAQVVSLHCSLDENTFHLLNEDRLNMMKKDAVLVNCARGPVIDEVALTNFLQANENFRWDQQPPSPWEFVVHTRACHDVPSTIFTQDATLGMNFALDRRS